MDPRERHLVEGQWLPARRVDTRRHWVELLLARIAGMARRWRVCQAKEIPGRSTRVEKELRGIYLERRTANTEAVSQVVRVLILLLGVAKVRDWVEQMGR